MDGVSQDNDDRQLANCFREADRRHRLVEITGNTEPMNLCGMIIPGEWRVLLVNGANGHHDATAPTLLEAFQRALQYDAAG